MSLLKSLISQHKDTIGVEIFVHVILKHFVLKLISDVKF